MFPLPFLENLLEETSKIFLHLFDMRANPFKS